MGSWASGLDWDHSTKTRGVFRIASENHQGWSDWVDKELGNYDYLLGIDVGYSVIPSHSRMTLVFSD